MMAEAKLPPVVTRALSGLLIAAILALSTAVWSNSTALTRLESTVLTQKQFAETQEKFAAQFTELKVEMAKLGAALQAAAERNQRIERLLESLRGERR